MTNPTDLARKLLRKTIKPDTIYADVSNLRIRLRCVSVENTTFICQETPDSTRITGFIRLYQDCDLEEQKFTVVDTDADPNYSCYLCGSSKPELASEITKCKHINDNIFQIETAHKQCVEEYNELISQLQSKLEPHEEEIHTKILTQNI